MAEQPEDANPLLERPLTELLERLSSEERTPASGSTAALVVALAASIVSKAARLSGAWPGAGGAIAQANALRERAAFLAHADAIAYEDALATLHGTERAVPGSRDAAIRDALFRAAEIPTQIANVACDVAVLAADVAEGGNAELAPDAAVAALLAEAAARSARHLLAVNLASLPEAGPDPSVDEVVESSSSAAKRALAAAVS